MKSFLKFIFSLSFLLVPYYGIAQAKLNGEIKYICSINIGMDISNFEAFLYFNKDSTYFQTVSELKKDEPINYLLRDKVLEANYNINIKDTVGFKIISDKRANKIFSREILINKLVPVVEPIPNFNWIVQEDTKKIGETICQKATCTFRGRNYIAWFATDINVDAGPYKFQGLPGLILEVIDDKNLISFVATQITFPFKNKIPINPKYYPKPISRKAYVVLAKKNMDKLSKFLQGSVRSEQMKGKITVKTKAIGLEDLNEPL